MSTALIFSGLVLIVAFAALAEWSQGFRRRIPFVSSRELFAYTATTWTLTVASVIWLGLLALDVLEPLTKGPNP